MGREKNPKRAQCMDKRQLHELKLELCVDVHNNEKWHSVGWESSSFQHYTHTHIYIYLFARDIIGSDSATGIMVWKTTGNISFQHSGSLSVSLLSLSSRSLAFSPNIRRNPVFNLGIFAPRFYSKTLCVAHRIPWNRCRQRKHAILLLPLVAIVVVVVYFQLNSTMFSFSVFPRHQYALHICL